MNNIEKLSAIISRFKLQIPLTDDLKSVMVLKKYKTLIIILKKLNLYNVFYGVIIKVFYTLKKVKIRLSITQSKAMVLFFSFLISSAIAGISVTMLYKIIYQPGPILYKIVHSAGTVNIFSADGKSVSGSVNKNIMISDTVQTGEKSAVFIAGKFNVIKIFQNTVLKMSNVDNKQNVIYLEHGKISSVFKKLKKNNEYRIETKSVIVAVRGTTFSVESAAEGVHVLVADGKVDVKRKDGSRETRSVFPGEKVFVTKDEILIGPMTEPEKEEFKDISETYIYVHTVENNSSNINNLPSKTKLYSADDNLKKYTDAANIEITSGYTKTVIPADANDNEKKINDTVNNQNTEQKLYDIGVYKFSTDDDNSETAADFSDMLFSEISAKFPKSINLRKQKLGSGKVRYKLTGELAKLGDTIVVTVKLRDVLTNKIVYMANETVNSEAKLEAVSGKIATGISAKVTEAK